MVWLAKNKYPVPLDYNKEGYTEAIFQFYPERDNWGRWDHLMEY
jgi:hypothetical protein